MKKKRGGFRDKPLMCDPGMCGHCTYVGEGDFLCDLFRDDEGHPAIFVVEDWKPNENYMKCKEGRKGPFGAARFGGRIG